MLLYLHYADKYSVGYDTDGMGLYELLTMVEDLGATPILGVFDGYAANDESIANTSQLDKYITDAVNELQSVRFVSSLLNADSPMV
jgi:hypothetical protein